MLISDPIPIQPEILKQNIRIPTCVLYPLECKFLA